MHLLLWVLCAAGVRRTNSVENSKKHNAARTVKKESAERGVKTSRMSLRKMATVVTATDMTRNGRLPRMASDISFHAGSCCEAGPGTLTDGCAGYTGLPSVASVRCPQSALLPK